MSGSCYHDAIGVIQFLELCRVGGCVGIVFASVSGVEFCNSLRQCLHQDFGICQREPNVFIVFDFFGMGFVFVVMLVFFSMGFMLVMFFVRFGFFAVFMMVLFFGLHAFDDFFFLDAVTQGLEHVHCQAVFVGSCLERLFDPFVRFTAYVHHHVGLGDCCDVLCRRFVAVQVHAVLDEERKAQGIGAVAQDFFEPCVLRINGGYDRNFLAAVGCRFFDSSFFGV